MPYAINRYNGSELVILQDGTLDTTTSIGLLGRNYVGYGEIQNENFIYLLENFAGANPPARPLEGQSWYDSANNRLNAFDGTNWIPVGSAIVSETSPEVTVLGSLWLKTPTKQLFVYTATGWRLVGPEGVEGFGETRTQAVILRDTLLVPHAVLLMVVNDKVIAICSADEFEIYSEDAVDGFTILSQGITSSGFYKFTGNLTGNSTTTTQLETGRLINGVFFNGTSNITITASTTGTLTRGTYLTGSNFNGSTAVTWAVDASSNNILGKIVARDTTGSFDAGTITADQFNGPLAGNVTAIAGTSTFYKIVCDNIDGFTFSGTSGAALRLSPGRRINGVLFDATQDITVPTAAENLSGVTIADNVKASSLTSVGTLTSLNVATSGITVGNSNEMTISIVASTPTLSVNNGSGLKIRINDIHQGGGQADFLFMSSDQALAAGGDQRPAFVGDADDTCNIGLPTKPFSQVYADVFNGIATSAQYADLAENYVSDTEYQPGTVLEFGGEFEVTLAEDGTNRVAGVVTTNPAYLMNSKCEGTHIAAIALQGRTPCKIRGNVRKGDMLMSGGNGFARRAQTPQIGTIIGKALQDFNGIEGVIEVAVGRV
jgi:hypothetical protein